MKASDLFIKALENEGVEYVFGIPGEENLDFLESAHQKKIKLILTRHEQVRLLWLQHMAASQEKLVFVLQL